MRRPWLKRLCHPDSYARFQWFRFVQGVPGPDGRLWSVATNARGLLGVGDLGVMARADRSAVLRTPGGSYSPANTPQRMQLTGFLSGWIPDGAGYACELADLRQWLGPRLREKCPECKGEGTTGEPGSRVYAVCDTCDGDRIVEPVRQSVRLLPETWVDSQLVSTYLPRRLLGWSRCCEVGTGSAGAVVVRSVEPSAVPWVAVVMSLDKGDGRHDSERKTAPRYVPGLGAVWHWRAERRYMLADWLAERGENIEEIEALPF